MRVLIDDGVLRGYVARAKQWFPCEWGELIWGHRDGDDFVITVIDRAFGESDEEELDIDTPWEFGDTVNGQTLLGTIHSHPNWTCAPSETDLESAAEPPSESVFGIMSITKTPSNRWLTSYGFYLTDGVQVELVVSKPAKIKRKNGRKKPAVESVVLPEVSQT
jgi:proteasome lid subunit RPN8/RPN11